MEIAFLGHSSFRLKGKAATLVTDPFSSQFVGIKFPKIDADIVTVSHQHGDHNFAAGVEGTPFVISEPGEYEIRGVSVFGFSVFHDRKMGAERGKNTVYSIEIDGVRFCHLGDLGENLSPELLEEIGVVDILMIPIGGGPTIGPGQAAEIVQQIEPAVVLPMHFKMTGMSGVFNDLAPVDEFLSEAGVETPERTDKLSITKDKLPGETKIVLLERKY